jgi:hypothetical protein
MFGRRMHLFTIFGFKVGIDFTWFFLAVLVGIITLKDMLKFLDMKIDLEGG